MQGDPEPGDPMGPVKDWVLQPFFALPGGRDVSQLQTEVSWEGEVSP
jgi:hypothetical protein